MKILQHHLDCLNLIEISKNTYEYNLKEKDLRITIYEESGRFVIIGRYKYTTFLAPVSQKSYIDFSSLNNFGELAGDGIKPTSFKILVIDKIVGILVKKSLKLIRMN